MDIYLKTFSILKSVLFQSFLKSFKWISIESFIRLSVNFYLLVSVINYLGPKKYGSLSLALIVVNLFVSSSSFGARLTTINELNSNKNSALSAYYGIRFYGILLYFTVLAIYMLIIGFDLTLFITSLIIPLRLFEFKQIYFESINDFKTISKAKIWSFIFFSTLISIALYYELGLNIIALAYVAEICLFYIIISLKFKFQKIKVSLNFQKTKELFIKSYPFGLSIIISILNARMDQLFVNYFISTDELGIFSSAVKVCEIAIIPIGIISGAIYQPLLKLFKKSFNKFAKTIYLAITISSIYSLLISLIIYFNSEFIVKSLFSTEFYMAKEYMSLYIFTLSPYMAFFILDVAVKIKGRFKFLLKLSMFSLLLNAILNPILINYYGVYGVIYSSLLVNIFYYSFYIFKARKILSLRHV